ncbi:PLP-dependent aminotransferase family protein [Curvibacter sp. CHRR-16]|uniref:aminotransferase-like domain-containing protein n=1 Tax=Curvibacter sp. CHRR-16 TaxID=2835872 RepID=UPI001BDB6189|nr:PLP-dependent aminotransferase family protein [Curvibacter sp. CHRR-16]MBT0570463.1 PLP-dependent aminotransferase family protein [Curvibacter sp. CHRR-16]
MIAIDRQSTTPLSDQIEQRLRQLVQGGLLPAASRLPSIRQLAGQLAVSPNTVVLAYDRLMALGLIESRGTAGYFVRAQQPPHDGDASVLEAGDMQDGVWLAQQANDLRPGMLLASSGVLPPAWLADAIPATTVQRALARSPAGMASRCPPQGLLELREHIASLLRDTGVPVDAGRIMTTYGATHSIDLICRTFAQAGDAVLVEDPGYFLMLERLRQQGLRPIPIRRTPDGLDVEQLQAACIEHRPRLLFVQTALHNPTGWSSSAANLHQLLVLARQHQLLLAEDDVHGHFYAGHTPRLASLAGLEGVIYYSSFCKALSPSVRLGYLAAEPALLKALLREKICSVMTCGALNEYVMLEVLAAGRWRKHLARLQTRIHKARVHSTRLLQEAGIALDHPGAGGIFLWGRVPDGVDMDVLLQDAYSNHIVLAKGSAFSSSHAFDRHIRFNVAFSQHPQLSQYLQARFALLAQGLRTATNPMRLKPDLLAKPITSATRP